MTRHMRRALLVGSLAAVLVAVAIASSSASSNVNSTLGPCKTRSASRLIDYISAFNSGQVGTLDSIVAAGPSFRWYFVDADVGQRLDDASHDRSSLRQYFSSRVAQHEQLALLTATVKQRLASPNIADFSFSAVRQATDIPTTRYLAKGAFVCDARRVQLIVLAMGPH